MNRNTKQFAEHQQSIWLDHISRELLLSGTLAPYITDLGSSGLTSNPMIFETAIASGDVDDANIRALMRAGLSGEDLFFELALEDLAQAADLFRPRYDASGGLDGWVSLEVSPLLAVTRRAQSGPPRSCTVALPRPICASRFRALRPA